MFQGHSPRGGPRIPPVAFSLIAHAVVLALVAAGPASPRRKPRNRYQEVFEPNEKKLVWYRFKEKLPEIAPPKIDGSPEPPRADRIAPQTIRSKQDAPAGSQRIWRPEPAPLLTADVPAPNVLAVAAPKTPARLYVPPDVVKPPAPPVNLPDAPAELRSALPAASPVQPARLRRRFDPPKPAPKPAIPDLPDAPLARADLPSNDPFDAPKLPPKRYTPPEPPKPAEPVAQLPEAPSTPRADSLSQTAALTLPARKLTRTFTPPSSPQRRAAAPASLDAPQQVASAALPSTQPALAGPALPSRPRYVPPTARPGVAPAPPSAIDPAPSLPAGTGANLSAAIVGLKPIDAPVPDLAGIRPADIAAGPTVNKTTDGAGALPTGTAAAIPGLIVRGAIGNREPPASTAVTSRIASVMTAAPTARETLSAAIRNPAAERPTPGAPRPPVSDFAFSGRTVYSMVIQMPNVTSAAGSWMIWFAEREPKPGPLQPPGAIRKVDPIYPRAAADERRQGRVRVAAILGIDGRIGEVFVVKGVDPRIDAAAITALRKWEFAPAMRAGMPVEVDAIIEIPFLLATPGTP